MFHQCFFNQSSRNRVLILSHIKPSLFLLILMISGTVCFAQNTSSDDTDVINKNFAVAVYNPYIALVALHGGPVFLSGEIELNLNRYISIASEGRYIYFPRVDFPQYGSNASDPAETYYTVGPGMRLYPQGEGMKGFFLASYYQLFAGSNEKRLNIFKYNIVTFWAGCRRDFEHVYFESAVGALWINTSQYGNFFIRHMHLPVLPMFSIGFGVWI